MKYAPIVLFVYKRPYETKKVLEALAANEEAAQSELIVYADGPKSDAEKESCEAVRQLVRNCTGFANVTLYAAEKNRGLANSVIAGVTETLEKYEKVIVLEDDLVTSKYFLRFMNEALERYENDESVCCVHAFSYPTKYPEIQYFLRRGADCWGWATWKRGWQIFEQDPRKLYNKITCRKLQKLFDRNGAFPYTKMLKDQAEGKIDSWAIRWYASAFLAEKYTLQSNVMLVENIGFGKQATHCCDSTHKYKIVLAEKKIVFDRNAEKEKVNLQKEHMHFLSLHKVAFFKRCIIKLKKILQKII